LSKETPAFDQADIAPGRYEMRFFDPITGVMTAPQIIAIAANAPIHTSLEGGGADRVALLRRITEN